MKKALFYVLLLSVIACKKTEIVETASALDSSAAATVPITTIQPQPIATDSSPVDIPASEPITITTMNYSFVVFDIVSRFDGSRKTAASDIQETPSEMSEDEKYRLLDRHLNDFKDSGLSASYDITSRDLKSYSSYSEASKARERFLGRSGGSSSDAAQGAAAAAANAARDAARDAARETY